MSLHSVFEILPYSVARFRGSQRPLLWLLLLSTGKKRPSDFVCYFFRVSSSSNTVLARIFAIFFLLLFLSSMVLFLIYVRLG